MNHNYNNKNILSGIFIILGMLVVFISVIMFGGDRSFLTSYYNVRVSFNQIQGLNVGSIVSLSGINIGNISAINFSNENKKIIITLNLDTKYKSKIRMDSTASIKTQGALGDKYIYIRPGSADSAELKNNDFLLSEDDDDFFDLLTKEAPKIANIGEVITELKTLLNTLNQDGQMYQLLKNLNQASKQIEVLSREGQLLISDTRKSGQGDIKQSLHHLNNILKKIDSGEGTLGALVNDPSVHERLTAILGKPPRNSYLKPLIRATIKTKDQ